MLMSVDLLPPNNVSMRRGVEEDVARSHLRLGQLDRALECAKNVVSSGNQVLPLSQAILTSIAIRDVNTGFLANLFLVVEHQFKAGFRLLKTCFKPVFGFSNLHKNMLLYKANNFIYYML